jgi:Resolvase, N terminal domain
MGYARVSTDDQNPALQIAALKKAGCQTLFKDEGISGATTKRPALLRCLKKLTPGDTLILIDDGQRREDVADLFKVNRTAPRDAGGCAPGSHTQSRSAQFRTRTARVANLSSVWV